METVIKDRGSQKSWLPFLVERKGLCPKFLVIAEKPSVAHKVMRKICPLISGRTVIWREKAVLSAGA